MTYFIHYSELLSVGRNTEKAIIYCKVSLNVAKIYHYFYSKLSSAGCFEDDECNDPIQR